MSLDGQVDNWWEGSGPVKRLKDLDLMNCDPDEICGGSSAEWEELIPGIIARAERMSDEEIDRNFTEREKLLYLEYCGSVYYEFLASSTDEDYE